MANCPKCGALIPEKAPNCSACGTSFASPPPSSINPPPSVTMSRPSTSAVQSKTSGFAIASLVLGLIPITGLLGLIFGIVALVQIGNNQGPLRGRGLAISGIVLSIFVPIFLLPALLYPVFSKAREKARETQCMSNQRQIATTMMIYAQENNGTMPAGWEQIAVASSVLLCKTENPGALNTYGYNKTVAGKEIGKITNEPSTLLLTADGGDAQNFITSSDDIKVRHGNDSFIASFLDGHVEGIPEGKEVRLQ